MTQDRPTLLKREKTSAHDDLHKELVAVLIKYAPGKESFKFAGAIHCGGLGSLEIVDKIK